MPKMRIVLETQDDETIEIYKEKSHEYIIEDLEHGYLLREFYIVRVEVDE